MSDYYKDKVCWTVDGKIFHNKFQALQYVNRSSFNHSQLRFQLFDTCFSSLDWSREPSEDFEALLLKRALQLRESYDYLRLWYSGGADSHTVLRTFVENRIPVDEILVYRCSPAHDFDGVGNSEVNKVALPFLKEIENLIPKTKITQLDLGKTEYELIYRDGWMENLNVLRFRPYSRACIYNAFPILAAPGEKGLRHCDIIGKDKPRLTVRNGRYYSYCWDGLYASVVGDPFVEYFFVTDALPELHLKQCHLIKRWHQQNISTCPDIEWLFEQDKFATVDRICRYPLWRPYSLQKKGEISSPKAEEALQQASLSLPNLHRRYVENLHSVERELSLHCNGKAIKNGFIGVRSLEYDMGA